MRDLSVTQNMGKRARAPSLKAIMAKEAQGSSSAWQTINETVTPISVQGGSTSKTQLTEHSALHLVSMKEVERTSPNQQIEAQQNVGGHYGEVCKHRKIDFPHYQ